MNDTLYITDLDGTLLDSGSKVSPRSEQLLNRAIADGALFSVATARTPATVSQLLKGVDMRLPGVVMTGVALWNPADGRYSDVKHFSPETVREVLRVYRDCGLPSFLYTLSDNMIKIYHTGPVSATEQAFIDERADSPYKRFYIPASGNSEIPECVDDAVLFFAMQPSGPAAAAYEKMKGVEGVNPIFYFDPTYGDGLAMSEAFPAGASKAEAARRLAAIAGASRIVAFGDNINDLPLMRVADVAVAVANAIPEVKEQADIVIGDHDMDAVAEFIYNDNLRNGHL